MYPRNESLTVVYHWERAINHCRSFEDAPVGAIGRKVTFLTVSSVDYFTPECVLHFVYSATSQKKPVWGCAEFPFAFFSLVSLKSIYLKRNVDALIVYAKVISRVI